MDHTGIKISKTGYELDKETLKGPEDRADIEDKLKD
jgi:hypothetical protein